MVINNEIKYFLPGHKQDNVRRAGTEITKLLQRYFKDVFNGIGYFDGIFSMQVKPNSKSFQAPPKMCSLCTTKHVQRGVTMTPTARHHETTRCR